jgi:hypothetical protein
MLSGCFRGTVPVSDRAICDGLEAPIFAHVDALVVDGGPKSVATGRTVVAAFDGACQGVL